MRPSITSRYHSCLALCLSRENSSGLSIQFPFCSDINNGCRLRLRDNSASIMPTTRRAARKEEDIRAKSPPAPATVTRRRKLVQRRSNTFSESKIRPSPLKVNTRSREERISPNHDDIEKGEEASHQNIRSAGSTTDSESTSKGHNGLQRKASLRLRRVCADYSDSNRKPSIRKKASVSSPKVQDTPARETSHTKTKHSLNPRRSLRSKANEFQRKIPIDAVLPQSSGIEIVIDKEETNSESRSNDKELTSKSTNISKDNAKHTTKSSSPTITKETAPKSVTISQHSVKTSSFYSKKSKSTPRLKDWLQTARTRDERPTTSSTEDSLSSKGLKSKPYPSTMKDSNTKTPISRIFKANLKHTQISTPIVRNNAEPEHLFGFENLLEPAASILQDVSPIGQIPLPSEVRKRKKAEKLTASFLDSNYPDVPQKRNKPRRAKAKTKPPQDEDDGTELQLFQVEPIVFESPTKVDDIFEYKEPVPPKLPKPAKTSEVTNKFDMGTALPWQDIMDHELIIESV